MFSSLNRSSNPTSCGAGNGFMFVLLMLITFVYTVVLIVKMATSPNRKFFGDVLLLAWALPVLFTLVSAIVVQS